MASMIRVAACFSLVLASTMFACGSRDEEPRTQAEQYATDPIPCAQDSDCCVVNDGCHSTAYVVAAKDSAKVSSLIASADHTTCDRCVTPMVQLSCVSGVCVGQRVNIACSLATPYPGNHCGTLDVPSSCLPPSASEDPSTTPAAGGALKPRAIIRCGG
jgi:hypothetical protein